MASSANRIWEHGIEIERVAEIIVTAPDGKPKRRGSGYLIAADTVRTSAHVVQGACQVRVRVEADQPTEWFRDGTKSRIPWWGRRDNKNHTADRAARASLSFWKNCGT